MVKLLSVEYMGKAPSDGKSRFFFIVRAPDWEDDDLEGTLLPTAIAAVAYARRIIGELREAGDYGAPNLMMIVKDGMGNIVDSISFSTVSAIDP